MFSLRQKEGAIHTEEMVYELNPLGEQPPASSLSPHWCLNGSVGGGGCGQQNRLPTSRPCPQTTEAGPWRFLATLIPISFLMEISAPLSGLQVRAVLQSLSGSILRFM